MRHHPHLPLHARDERGSATIWMVLTVAAFTLIVGIAVDLGGRMFAVQRVHDVAAEAARTGAQQVDVGNAIRGHAPALDPGRATSAALTHIHAAGHTGTATVTNGQLQVTVTGSYTPVFLSAIGVGALPVTGTGEARLVRAQNGTER